MKESPVGDRTPGLDEELPVGDKELPVGDKELPVGDKELPVGDRLRHSYAYRIPRLNEGIECWRSPTA
ncbi:hypothetical protein NG791_26415 [Laspinema sp. D1]|uniref:hypothetical protein n=1 Tax=Laspinema palackyanum TaxID=3231601 RepID=UPI00347599CC|nr:hypothetical protein [Laspinema sp. D2b]